MVRDVPTSVVSGPVSTDVTSVKVIANSARLAIHWQLAGIERPVPGEGWIYSFRFTVGDSSQYVAGVRVRTASSGGDAILSDRFTLAAAGGASVDAVGTEPHELAGQLDMNKGTAVIELQPQDLGLTSFHGLSLRDISAMTEHEVTPSFGVSADFVDFPRNNLTVNARKHCA